MRFGSLFLLALPMVVACGGGGADETVSGVFPSSAFLGRQVRVEISGDVTDWKPGASVDFGAGVTVQNVSVASPTALFADVTVLDDAAPGLRDVTVQSGGDTLVLSQAFQLESAIKVEFRGTVAQGSIATFAINNLDFETPFDTTSTGGGLFGPPLEFVGTTITGPTGVTFQIGSVTPFAITGIALMDVDAAPGPITVSSGLDEVTTSALGVDLDVKARTATALTAGTAASGTVEGSWASSLYEFNATSQGLVTFDANGAASARFALLPASGHFEDLLGYTNQVGFVQAQSNKFYVVFVDDTGTKDYSFNVKANNLALTSIAATAEPGNNTSANAQALAAMPSHVTGATLVNIGDADWLSITVTTADVGKKIRVLTTGSDAETDTVVEVFQTDGTVAFGPASSDLNYHENHTSPAIATAGKYWIKVTASQDYFVQAHNTYTAVVWLE